MKHTKAITILLISLFFVTQLVGLFIINSYAPKIVQVERNGTIVNETNYSLPYGTAPPEDTNPQTNLLMFIIAFIVAISLMFVLMYFRFESFIRIWFLLVVTVALGISLNSFIVRIPEIQYASIIALIVAFPLAIMKIFKKNMIIHNFTEILIYPGIASIFVPLLDIWTASSLLLIISFYDMYAVWKAGFMQKMAKFQIEKAKIFAGFFVPYIGKKDRLKINEAKLAVKAGKPVPRNLKINLAILGGGDVVFPMIFAGVVLFFFGLFHALLVTIFSTLALAYLFYISEKGKFYPAMPFITIGTFAGFILGLIINLI